MAVICGESTNRRDFLKTTLLSFGAVLTLDMTRASAASNKTVKWALLSDTHIPQDVQNSYRGFFPYNNLEKIIPLIKNENYDGAVITGDLARLEGKVGDYENLKKLVQPALKSFPFLMSLGNHDHRDNFKNVFSDVIYGEKQDIKKKHVLVVNTGDLDFVVLDSLLFTNKTPGLLGKDQREWLQGFLEKSDDKPVVFFLHHPLDDGDGSLLDSDRFLKIIEPFDNVKAVVFGHSHRYDMGVYKKIHWINLPATGYNFDDSDAVGYIDAEFDKNGCRLTLKAIAGNMEQNNQTTKLEWL